MREVQAYGAVRMVKIKEIIIEFTTVLVLESEALSFLFFLFLLN